MNSDENQVVAPLVAGVLLHQDDKFLLLEHNTTESAHGLWGWPAGFIEPNEELEAAALREAKEETNLNVRIVRTLGTFGIKRLFAGEVIGGELRIDPIEILSAAWLSPDGRGLSSSRRIRWDPRRFGP